MQMPAMNQNFSLYLQRALNLVSIKMHLQLKHGREAVRIKLADLYTIDIDGLACFICVIVLSHCHYCL